MVRAPASSSPATSEGERWSGKSKVGEGTAVNWPTGAGGKGNEGVAAFVGRLANSIGYVEYAYVKQNKLNYVQLQNAEGAFVAPMTMPSRPRLRVRTGARASTRS